MKNFASFILACLVFSSIFFACGKNEDENITVDYNYEYFPLQVGKYKIYQVDSILFDTISGGKVKIDSFRLYQKEVITDTFTNIKGEKVFTIDRFERKNQNDAWILKDVVTEYQNKSQAIRTDQGLSLVKMTFPLRRRQDWNSLLYVDPDLLVTIAGEQVAIFKNWETLVTEINKPEVINGKNHSKVMTIKFADDENKLELRKVTEKYVRDTGLVSNEMLILDTQATTSNLEWRKKAQRGFIYRQILIENN